MKSFHHAKPPVTIIVCSWKEKNRQITYMYVFLYTHTHRHIHYMGNFWKPWMISISFTHSGKTMYMKLLMFKNQSTKEYYVKDNHHPTKHSSTVLHAIGIPELSQIWPEFTSFTPKATSHKLSDKTNWIKCLIIRTQIWKPVNTQTQISVSKSQDMCFRHFMRNTCETSIPNPSVSTGCLLESDTL